MPKKKNVLFIIGTRPDAIKMVSTIRQFKKSKKFLPIILATSQHKEMLSDVIELFKLEIDFDLKIMKRNQTLIGLSSRLLVKIDQIYNDVNPELVFVQGDTSSSFLGALCAFYRKIPVAHIEAGLRTGDIFAPFPEEVNRIFIDEISTYLFPPTKLARDNLTKAGINNQNLLVTGNTGIDALLMTLKEKKSFKNPILKKIHQNKLITITTHRRESFGKPMENIVNAISYLAATLKDFNFVLPVHPNPNVKEIIEKRLGSITNLILTKPLVYSDFVKLMELSFLLITDSGGVQEEAPVLGKPVVVLREKTERQEAVKKNAAVLVGSSREKIIETVLKLVSDKKFYNKMAKVRYIYGDGNAGEKIYKFLTSRFNN